MAMLNIGLLIFGAVYALLPELTGKALYSERMAWVHVWTTFLAGMTVFGLWLVQGLDGAPRRWSVLPSDYDTLTRISLPFVVILTLAQALFFWNVIQTVRGRSGAVAFDERGIPVPAPPSRSSTAVAEALIVLCALFLVSAFAAGGYLVGRGADEPATPTTPTETAAPDRGDSVAGKQVFTSAGCGSCHVLADAGGTGTAGPALDGNDALTKALVVDRVTNGTSKMPSFSSQLSEDEIEDVAAYVMAAKK
jgi:mono/diheme cytochrome c family protein